jgi:hypothetical protein
MLGSNISFMAKIFPVRLPGDRGTIGFYTTRFVEAANPEEAELLALANLQKEEMLNPAGVPMPKDAKVFFEEITEVRLSDVPKGGGAGFTFYAVEKE